MIGETMISEATKLPCEAANPRRIVLSGSHEPNVSNVGHWGGGDLELGVSSLAQVPEAAPLIRASFQARCENASRDRRTSK